jgi:hypothetical protein
MIESLVVTYERYRQADPVRGLGAVSKGFAVMLKVNGVA